MFAGWEKWNPTIELRLIIDFKTKKISINVLGVCYDYEFFP